MHDVLNHFLILCHNQQIDRFSGANPTNLENKIKEHILANPTKSEDCGVPGHFNLVPNMIVKSSCECLNESDDHTLENCLNSDSAYLESDVDEQLIISLTFR